MHPYMTFEKRQIIRYKGNWSGDPCSDCTGNERIIIPVIVGEGPKNGHVLRMPGGNSNSPCTTLNVDYCLGILTVHICI